MAVVGASRDLSKWGYWIARGAVQGEHRRSVHLVGRSGGELFGHTVVPSLAHVAEPPELVVLAVPANALEEAVEESLAAGARALIAIAAGLGEQGGEGRKREQRIVQRVRAASAILLGPNCLGLYDSTSELDVVWNELPAGPVALVSQSGNVALEVALLLRDYGLGFSRMVSIGNQADVDVTELVDDLARHEATEAIAIYCEDFRDGRAFAQAARTAGKPVVLMTVGRTEASVRAARSHTGALTSDHDVVAAACRTAGIHIAQTPRELVDVVHALLAPVRARGRRVAIVGDGGGYGAIAADLCGAHELELPVLGEATQYAIAEVLPPTASTANPVDLAGAGEQDVFSFARSTRLLLETSDVDAVLLSSYFGGYSDASAELREQELEVARLLADAVTETQRPLVLHSMYWSSPPAVELRARRVPVYRAVESAVRALAALADADVPHDPVPSLPPASPPLVETDYFAAREALAATGIPFAAARRAVTREQVLAAGDAVGYPVVVKALGRAHKSDEGGVVLGIRDRTALERVVNDLAARLAPPEFAVERHVEADGVELIVGTRHDPRFGPVLVVGAGGLYVETLHDTAVALAPTTEAEAQRLIESLRIAPLLTGARGRPKLDVQAAARVAAALSRFAAEHPELAEVELNPLLVEAEGAIALDVAVTKVEGV